MSLARPALETNPIFKDAQRLLMLQADIYYALGTIEDSEVPTTKSALADMIEGAEQVLVPLGSVTKGSGKLSFKQAQVEFDDWTIPKKEFELEGEIDSIYFDEERLSMIESDEMRNEISILVKPRNADNVFFGISGVTLIFDGEVPFTKDNATIKLKFKVTVPKITDCIKLNTRLS